jgi:hypothetical protein
LFSACGAAVAQTRLPALVLTPPWYSSYADQFTLAQAHAQAWLDGTLPEISALPAALWTTTPSCAGRSAPPRDESL